MAVKNRIADMLPEIAEWRQDFHRHPELLFDVHRTAARVAELCRSFGCDEVVPGIGISGVVGVMIRGTWILLDIVCLAHYSARPVSDRGLCLLKIHWECACQPLVAQTDDPPQRWLRARFER